MEGPAFKVGHKTQKTSSQSRKRFEIVRIVHQLSVQGVEDFLGWPTALDLT